MVNGETSRLTFFADEGEQENKVMLAGVISDDLSENPIDIELKISSFSSFYPRRSIGAALCYANLWGFLYQRTPIYAVIQSDMTCIPEIHRYDS